MEFALSIILCIAWVSGIFPASCPLPSSKYFRTYFISFATLFTAITGVIGTIVQIDSLQSFGQILPDDFNSQAYSIIVTAGFIVDVVHPIAIRLIGIVHGSKITRMVTSLSQVYKFSEEHHRPLTVQTGFLNVSKTKQVLLYTLISILTAMYTFSLFQWVSLYMLSGYRSYGPYLSGLLPSGETLTPVVGTIGSFYGAYGVILVEWVVIGLGTKLLRVHNEYFSCLLGHMRNPGVQMTKDGGKELAKRLFEHFLKLQKSATACGEVMGIYSLFTLAWILPQVLYSIHGLLWRKIPFTGYNELLQYLLSAVALVSIGQAIQRQVQTMSKELKREIVASKIHKRLQSDEFNEVLKAAQEWTWELTAGGIFPINNTCFCTIVGALVTSVLFTVQLELAQTASGLRAGTECGNASFLTL